MTSAPTSSKGSGSGVDGILNKLFSNVQASRSKAQHHCGCEFSLSPSLQEWETVICKREVAYLDILGSRNPEWGDRHSVYFVLDKKTGDRMSVVHLRISATDAQHHYEALSGHLRTSYMARFKFDLISEDQHSKDVAASVLKYQIPNTDIKGQFGDMLAVLCAGRPTPCFYYALDEQHWGVVKWIGTMIGLFNQPKNPLSMEPSLSDAAITAFIKSPNHRSAALSVLEASEILVAEMASKETQLYKIHLKIEATNHLHNFRDRDSPGVYMARFTFSLISKNQRVDHISTA
ncbi:hypothetical protein B0T26DRAFT_746576 [Lasiosphaeria miniovina]|uniref:Uncharacterized protein n=1 Tax=Lasiosphaeria miniovina TaxID=1954250 RepID=A0AA40EGK0_9PEZI|nr:uncharacterized protein B0T26DRAFT_746576 [Lasiosphaeria miniovina]KAK0734703.1 hypothetical protein B0T26DRAFT_746576 [Lasiosphaeria miniovina]